MLARLKSWGLGIAAFAVMVFYALTKKAQADAAETRADFAEDNAKVAEEQLEQLDDAVNAARGAVVIGREETKDAVEKAESGDFSGFNR